MNRLADVRWAPAPLAVAATWPGSLISASTLLDAVDKQHDSGRSACHRGQLVERPVASMTPRRGYGDLCLQMCAAGMRVPRFLAMAAVTAQFSACTQAQLQCRSTYSHGYRRLLGSLPSRASDLTARGGPMSTLRRIAEIPAGS